MSTASFLSRSLCFWLLPLLWSGRNKTLSIDDCGTIPENLSSKSAGGKLYKALQSTESVSSILHSMNLVNTFSVFQKRPRLSHESLFESIWNSILCPSLPSIDSTSCYIHPTSTSESNYPVRFGLGTFRFYGVGPRRWLHMCLCLNQPFDINLLGEGTYAF